MSNLEGTDHAFMHDGGYFKVLQIGEIDGC
jgi:hypothetical protein